MNVKAGLVMLIAVASLSPTSTWARDDDDPSYTIEDVTACSKDAMRLCGDKLSDIGAIEGCMKEHFSELKPKCQARFKR